VSALPTAPPSPSQAPESDIAYVDFRRATDHGSGAGEHGVIVFITTVLFLTILFNSVLVAAVVLPLGAALTVIRVTWHTLLRHPDSGNVELFWGGCAVLGLTLFAGFILLYLVCGEGVARW
jgi:hypothetical protein